MAALEEKILLPKQQVDLYASKLLFFPFHMSCTGDAIDYSGELAAKTQPKSSFQKDSSQELPRVQSHLLLFLFRQIQKSLFSLLPLTAHLVLNTFGLTKILKSPRLTMAAHHFSQDLKLLMPAETFAHF